MDKSVFNMGPQCRGSNSLRGQRLGPGSDTHRRQSIIPDRRLSGPSNLTGLNLISRWEFAAAEKRTHVLSLLARNPCSQDPQSAQRRA